MTKDGPLTFDTYDTNGETPELSAIGTYWHHTGNQKVYMIAGYAWNGATDEWNTIMAAPEGVTVVRPMNHLTGARDNGEQRYIQVSLV